MKYDIVFIPWRDWNSILIEGFARRESNILRFLEKNSRINKILVVNNFLSSRRWNKVRISNSKLKGKIIDKHAFSNLSKITQKIFVVNYDIHLPKMNVFWKFGIAQKFLTYDLNKYINFLGFNKSYITWSCDLFRIGFAVRIKKNELVFDAIDNLLEHNQFRKYKKSIARYYAVSKKNANVIFTVSKNLKESIFNNKAYVITNGTDIIKNNSNFLRPNDLPNGAPIVGYVGVIQERINVKLLEYVIRKLSNYNFVFVGPVVNEKYILNIKKQNNAFFLGPKHHSRINNYIQYFNVCIIPHKINKFTLSMNPLKLYEYLSMGKEVVTTAVPPSEKFKDVIHIVHSNDEFVKYIDQSIRSPYLNFSKIDIHKEISNEGWDHKIDQMISIIDKNFGLDENDEN